MPLLVEAEETLIIFHDRYCIKLLMNSVSLISIYSIYLLLY